MLRQSEPTRKAAPKHQGKSGRAASSHEDKVELARQKNILAGPHKIFLFPVAAVYKDVTWVGNCRPSQCLPKGLWKINLCPLGCCHLVLHTMLAVAFYKVLSGIKIIRVLMKVCFNVFFQIPGFVFIKHHKQESKFTINVFPQTIFIQNSFSANYKRSNETTVCVLKWNKYLYYTCSSSSSYEKSTDNLHIK